MNFIDKIKKILNDDFKYYQDNFKRYLAQEICEIKKDSDWDRIDKIVERNPKYMTDETAYFLMEIKKQYVIAIIGKAKPVLNMKQVVANANQVVNDSSLIANDDKYLYSHLMKALASMKNRDEAMKYEKYAGLIFDEKLRSDAKVNAFLKVINPNPVMNIRLSQSLQNQNS